MEKAMANRELVSAKNLKNDEFYTQIEDIERELKFYKGHFKDKIVYCNCDDPRESNFFVFFKLKFREYGLKKLITTCYKSRNSDLFTDNSAEKSVGISYEGVGDGNSLSLSLDGDFRNEECIEYLKQADIVATNPPFSLFKEYIAQLIKHEKKFIILGNQGSIGYRGIFSLFQENKVWLGPSLKGSCKFVIPNDREYAKSYVLNEKGQRVVTLGMVRWFTNLEHKKRTDEIRLSKKYNPKEYPRYDNYDAIEVSKVNDIPVDYDGVMGVPITFLDKYNPAQFEIVGNPRNDPYTPFKLKTYTREEKRLLADGKDINGAATVRLENGKLELKFSRVLIRKR